jgi:hypothetical protein
MKKQLTQFFLTVGAISVIICSLYLIAGRYNIAVAILVAAASGPLSGMLWTNEPLLGLRVVAIGIAFVGSLFYLGTRFSDLEVRLGIAVLTGIVWFSFGLYGVFTLA